MGIAPRYGPVAFPRPKHAAAQCVYYLGLLTQKPFRNSSWNGNGENGIRLIERSRTAVAGDSAKMFGRLMSTAPAADLLAIGDFVMACKHLRGIKQRAESIDGGAAAV